MKEVFKALRIHPTGALVQGDRKLDYNTFAERIDRFAGDLHAVACHRVNVGIVGSNSLELAIAILGTIQAGNTAVLLGADLPAQPMGAETQFCNISWLVICDESLREVSKFVTCGCLFYNKATTLIQWPRKKNLVDAFASVAFFLPTSGSTGKSKWVMLTHENISATLESSKGIASLDQEDKILITSSLQFSTALTFQFLQGLLQGAELHFAGGKPFLAPQVGNLLKKSRITVYSSLPANFHLLVSFFLPRKQEFEDVRFVGVSGSPISVSELENIERIFPRADVVQMYGLTECSPRVAAMPRMDLHRKKGSVGKAVPGVRLSIACRKGSTEGEIAVQGKNVMLGYYKNRKETSKVLRNGWFYTGDIGCMDDEGFLYLKGRKNHMLISGGLNIYPEELEQALLDIDGIEAAMVRGAKDPIMGEVPVAFVVFSTSPMGKKEVLAKLTKRLDKRKLPKIIYQTNSIPLTGRRKPNRKISYLELVTASQILC